MYRVKEKDHQTLNIKTMCFILKFVTALKMFEMSESMTNFWLETVCLKGHFKVHSMIMHAEINIYVLLDD